MPPVRHLRCVFSFAQCKQSKTNLKRGFEVQKLQVFKLRRLGAGRESRTDYNMIQLAHTVTTISKMGQMIEPLLMVHYDLPFQCHKADFTVNRLL